jgi:metal-responsive CopG/Arc/MetJ family transcriptional regulator
MKTISLKLDEHIFEDTEKVISKVKKSRNRYINEAIEFYNRFNKRKLIARKLAKESKSVRNESMAVLAEFESLSHED